MIGSHFIFEMVCTALKIIRKAVQTFIKDKCLIFFNHNNKKFFNHKGNVQYIFFIFLLVFFITGMGLKALLYDWKKTMELQLDLDRCVGVHSQQFARALNQLAYSNAAIQTLRVGSTVSIVTPSVKTQIISLIHLIATYQNVILKLWSIKEKKWEWKKGCENWTSFFNNKKIQNSPLPKMNFYRGTPDSSGEQALQWQNEGEVANMNQKKMPHEFFIQIIKKTRASASKIYVDQNQNIENKIIFYIPKPWKIIWNKPKTLRAEKI